MSEYGIGLGGVVSNERPARPWDIFNSNAREMPEGVAQKRLEICRGCEHFIKLTQMCSHCGCIMPAKTLLNHADCPVDKWGKVVYSVTEPGVVVSDGLPK